MTTKRGRKTSLSKEEVTSIVLKFSKKHNGIIKYKDIHHYANILYNDGTLNVRTSETFWRKKGRLGRNIIDDYNSKQIIDENRDLQKDCNNKLPNFLHILNKFYYNKEELIQRLIIEEKKYLSLLHENTELKQQIYEKQNNIDRMAEINEKLQSYVHQFLIFNYENNEDSLTPLFNLAYKELFNTAVTSMESSILVINNHLDEQKRFKMDKMNNISNIFRGNFEKK
ncbi:hypothetical protein [Lysinibacillus fusiformis]|uniref:hypothetical protein n=1 Tax=Lysinibacillus TaxID=400634 RepID=UPI001967E51F|nr:hypothetical protein [Lysinibacillus fusiformis]QSB10116.1 hypothetical protein JTI58_24635 [Lysinibacillus fusiformis]